MVTFVGLAASFLASLQPNRVATVKMESARRNFFKVSPFEESERLVLG